MLEQRYKMKLTDEPGETPDVVTAVQLTWDHWNDVCEFVPPPWFVRGVYLDPEQKPLPEGEVSEHMGLLLKNLAGEDVLALEHDWIVKDVQGAFKPWKPEAFHQTYEPFIDNENAAAPPEPEAA